MTPSADYVPSLDAAADKPLFLRISRAIAGDIRRGRLLPGARLPGSRELARRLDAHRNTVLAAYAELEQEGFIQSARARGTFVASTMPDPVPRRFAKSEGARPRAVSLPKLAVPAREPIPPNVIALVGGLPDARLLRRDLLSRAYRRVLTRGVQTLGYGSALGEPRLLRALAEHLRGARGVLSGEGELMLTRGSQMAFPLLARALCEPGEVIAVEALGYAPAWEGFRLGGAELCAVPLDRSGIRLERLQELAETTPLRAVYVTPHHQYPTAVTMSAPRRQGLLALAERYGFFVIEDDYDHEFHWSGRPVLPLASADPARLVVYVGTLSKLIAPGLRIGYVSAREEVVERLARLRTLIDRQGDHTLEAAVAEWIDDGEFDRHTKRARRAYAERREALATALQQHFGERLAFEPPPGGLAFWVRSELALPVERLAELALERGVLIHPARRFAFDRRPREFLRLGFPGHTPNELQKAVGVLAAIVKASAA